jgi:tetratricopeptide (TPR) repeat protein
MSILRFVSFILCFCALHQAFAQTSAKPDTAVTFAEFMPIPLLRTCQAKVDTLWTFDSLRNCGLNGLNQLIAQELKYPQQALADSIQGRVIISFVIDTTGALSDLQVVKDIGGGCGEESKRIFERMHEAGLRWLPAVNNQKKVALRMMWPIKFKIKEYEEPNYFTNAQGIQIYTNLDTLARYADGEDAFYQLILNQLQYPKPLKSTCKVGVMELSVLINANGKAEIENIIDFNQLGYEYQWEATMLIHRTVGMWTPAKFKNESVASIFPMRVLFKSDDAACATANKAFDRATITAAEGEALYNTEKYTEAIAKYTEALALHPNNAEYLYFRGSAHANCRNKEAACADYQEVKKMLGIIWFEQVYSLLCGK